MSEIPAAELGATQGGGLPLLFAFLPGFFLFSALCFLQTLTRTPPARLFAESSAMAKGIAVMFAQNKSRRHGQDRSLKRCSVPDGGGGGVPQWLDHARQRGRRAFYYACKFELYFKHKHAGRCRYYIHSHARPGSVNGIRILSSRFQNLLTSSQRLPPAPLLSPWGESASPCG